jgi:predicted MFS family arabinose efflux permease
VRRLLLLVGAIVFVDTMFYAALTPLLPEYSEDLNLSKAGAGLLSAAYPLGALVGGVPGGISAARFGVRPTLLVGLSVMAVTTVTFGFADSIYVLDAARFLQGVASTFTWTAALAWLVAAAPPDRRGETIGAAMGAAIFGALFGPVVGGVASVIGTGPAFASVAVLATVLAVWALRIPAFTPSEPQPISRLFGAVRDRGILMSIWFVLLPALLFGVLNVLAPLRLDVLGFSALAIGLTWLLSASFEAVLAPAIGRISDRRGRLVPIRAGLVGAGGGGRGDRRSAMDQPRLAPRDVRRARRVRVRHLLDTRDVDGRRPGRRDRARLRVRVRADQPRVGAGRRRGRGTRRRGGARNVGRGRLPHALGPLCRLADHARAAAARACA